MCRPHQETELAEEALSHLKQKQTVHESFVMTWILQSLYPRHLPALLPLTLGPARQDLKAFQAATFELKLPEAGMRESSRAGRSPAALGSETLMSVALGCCWTGPTDFQMSELA